MKTEIKYFYENGVEIEQHDLVYLEGFDSNHGVEFSGICKIASFCGEVLSAYLLGQKIYSSYDIEMYINDIEKLIKLDGKAINKALNETVKKLQSKIGN